MDEETDLEDRAVAQLEQLEETCSLRAAAEGPRTVARVGELLRISQQSTSEVLTSARATVLAEGVDIE